MIRETVPRNLGRTINYGFPPSRHCCLGGRGGGVGAITALLSWRGGCWGWRSIHIYAQRQICLFLSSSSSSSSAWSLKLCFFFQDSLYNFISRFLTVSIIFFRFFLRISHRSWMRWLLTVVRPRILQTWKYIAMILTSHPYKETVRFTALRCISVPIVQTLPPINFSHKSWTWKATFQP